MPAQHDSRPQLVLNATRLGDVGLEAWARPEGSERAPLAVVCVPGNPAVQFGNSHAKSPLISAVVQALREARIPVVSFDYKGVGMSAPGGANLAPGSWKIPTNQEAVETMQMVIGMATQHLSDRLVLCGYSYGSANALAAVHAGSAHAYISLSMGFNVWMFMTDLAAQESIKQEMESQSTLTCKALYVVGEKDRMTPLKQVERLVKARSDGGAGATVEVVRGGTHDLKGLETVVADFCAGFVADLQSELASATPAAAKAAEPEPAALAAAKKAEPEPADAKPMPVPAAKPEVFVDFRVSCLKSDPASVTDTFHITLPEDATVGLLRHLLGPALPKDVQVCELNGLSFTKLKDDAPLPEWVTIEEFKGAVGLDMVLTLNQCREAQAMMKARLQKPEIQQRLDQFEKDAKNLDAKYRIMLTGLLNKEVYPEIVSHFSLPDGIKGIQLLLGTIPTKNDGRLIEAWLELETLMRNKAMIKRAEEAAKQFRMASGAIMGA